MMLRREQSLRLRLFGAVAAVLVVLAWGARLLVDAVDAFQTAALVSALREQVAVLAESARRNLGRRAIGDTAELARAAVTECPDLRLTFLSSSGEVLFDSAADPARMENHLDRPEVVEARTNGWGVSTRWSSTVSRDLIYVAARVGDAREIEGYVRASRSTASMQRSAGRLRSLIGTTFGGIALAAVTLILRSAVSRERLWKRTIGLARSVARGEEVPDLPREGNDEAALLGRTLLRLRSRMATHVATVEAHRRTLADLVEQVRDGVVVADAQGRVLLMNAAARSLLRGPSEAPQPFDFRTGSPLEQMVSQHELQRLLAPHLAHSSESVGTGSLNAEAEERRIELEGATGRLTILVRVSDVSLPGLPGSSEPARGRMLVLTDISELIKALRTRSDFVTHASHELRTPIAAIRGAVETLSTLDLDREAEAARRFVDMIARHAGRLESLASDLLELSRIESGSRRSPPVTLPVATLSEELRGRWRDALDAGALAWNCTGVAACPLVRADARLLELILDNLVDNAIKFTPRGGRIELTWRKGEDWVAVDVADSGCGIPPADQERVFEPFYQVAPQHQGLDDRRASKRGTGLGLSIVRHAAAALGGTVSLRSELGVGTTVTLRISQPGPAASPPPDAETTVENFAPN